MSAVGHYLEQEGVASAVISLVREHSEVMQPPRALWVPFMLGRPLGAPDAPAFQRDVLHAVLRLFDEPSGPVLRDFPRDAPAPQPMPGDEEGEACPVNFSRPRRSGPGEHALAQALFEEIAQLRPWHDLATQRRGGSTVGLTGWTPERAAGFVVSFLGSSAPLNTSDRSLGEALKLAVDDLRAFYEEAATAQPGALSADAMERWFYLNTVAGEVLRAVHRAGLASSDDTLRFVAAKLLLPRSVQSQVGG